MANALTFWTDYKFRTSGCIVSSVTLILIDYTEHSHGITVPQIWTKSSKNTFDITNDILSTIQKDLQYGEVAPKEVSHLQPLEEVVVNLIGLWEIKNNNFEYVRVLGTYIFLHGHQYIQNSFHQWFFYLISLIICLPKWTAQLLP